ncbi:MAG: NCS2 family permease [Phycisphaerae bacterium]|nr:NCS2 family permease [Phycisphaerae bacterium]
MFDIRQRGSTVGREIVGGTTTFMAMSYILFVQPAVLSKTGMDAGGVFMATAIAAAAACFLMGLLANYPIALAPGMGQNFFFVFTLCGIGAASGAFALTWQEALALTCVTGALFLALSVVGFRARVLNAIPDALKSGIAAGIGLFIALIGFEWGNLIAPDPATGVTLAPLDGNYVALLTLGGLAVMLALTAWRARGAILIGILLTTAACWGVGQLWGVPAIQWQGAIAMPDGLGATAGGFVSGFASLGDKLLSANWLDVIVFAFILLFMDLFDTVGTLVGVAGRAGLMRDGRLPRAERALAADAGGTVLGAALGTSTVTSYIESATGVSDGARTGLAPIATGACLLAALLFQPVVMMVGGGVPVEQTLIVGGHPVSQTVLRYPMIAPALILVGAMMVRSLRGIAWDDVTEALPAFLTAVAMPFAYSISDGIALGFITYAVAKAVTGRLRECPLVVYIFAALFVARYALAALT